MDLSTLGWIFLILIILLVTYTYMTWPYNYFKNKGIPGPKPLPFVGNLTEMGKEPMWIKDQEWVNKYGNLVGLYIFGYKTLMVADKEMLRDIFIKDFDNFCDRTSIGTDSIMEHGLLEMKGQAWKDQRQQLSPYFSSGNMKMSTPAINKIINNLVTWLDEKFDKGEMVEARSFTEMMTLDVICSTAFGVEVNSCQNPDTELLKKSRELVKTFTTGNTLVMLTVLFPWFAKVLKFLNIEAINWSYFVKFTQHLIAQRKELKEKAGHDFVNILLKERKGDKKGLTDNEIIANAVLFLFAGYDTTAGTLAFLLYNLALNPECQEKVFQEIQETMGDDQDPNYESVQELTYMEKCIDETLRLFPLAPRIDRMCVKDTVVKGVHIEKGTSVMMPIWQLQRDPEVWDDPETFDPERFTPENKKTRDQLSYVPFGVGPRHCIGMRLAMLELKMAASKILRKFKMVRNDKTQVPLEFNPKAFDMTTKDGIWLSLEKRS